MHPLLSFLTHYNAACRGQFFDYQVSCEQRLVAGYFSLLTHAFCIRNLV